MDIRFQLIKPRKQNRPSPQKKSPKEIRLISPSQSKGLQYEQEAIDFLTAKGLTLLEKNLSCKCGELDLIMKDGDTLVAVEVRIRKNNLYGGAITSITKSKQQKLQKTLAYFLPYLSHKHYQNKQPFCRFDAVCFHESPRETHWLKNIFF
ncbi:YraN family protein [Pelistega suis]|uniref:YraN family protein n=1 Tax=Pelistega suis TaxID=1631957 RepID=UPI00211BE3FC|nr:YraN family protein [Pelistega suis]MCQ9328082.1 YraN family protein [Pelistega suis]